MDAGYAEFCRAELVLIPPPWVGYADSTSCGLPAGRMTGVKIMQWTAPAFEEVCLNCEINSYASAKL